MANFTYFIRERINIDGQERGTFFERTITDVQHTDSRVMTILTGSMTTIIEVASAVGAGRFKEETVKYIRITNHSSGSVNLQVNGTTEETNFLLQGSGSFTLSADQIATSFSGFNYEDLQSIQAMPQDPQATLSYLVVTA